MERVERDADRKNDVEAPVACVDANARQQRSQTSGEEVEVLEEPENDQIRQHANQEKTTSRDAIGRVPHLERSPVDDGDGKGNQEQESPVPPSVEQAAGEQQQDVLPGSTHPDVERQYDGEEKEVQLVSFGGAKMIFGFNNLVDGEINETNKAGAIKKANQFSNF